MKDSVVLGIDTSNYTTSMAVVSLEGDLIANLKLPLTVKAGERGLRQSDACFAHIKNLPVLSEELKRYLEKREVVCVGVSERPRNIVGSYMPCFLAGVAVAEGIASAASVPIYRFSHQCGHIMAAVFSSHCEELLTRDFAAFHISGGTTELLKVTYSDGAFKTELMGGSADLNAGQVIDRVGVKLGFSFPAGKYIEEAALTNNKKIPVSRPKINGFTINLSGLENLADKLYSETSDRL